MSAYLQLKSIQELNLNRTLQDKLYNGSLVRCSTRQETRSLTYTSKGTTEVRNGVMGAFTFNLVQPKAYNFLLLFDSNDDFMLANNILPHEIDSMQQKLQSIYSDWYYWMQIISGPGAICHVIMIVKENSQPNDESLKNIVIKSDEMCNFLNDFPRALQVLYDVTTFASRTAAGTLVGHPMAGTMLQSM